MLTGMHGAMTEMVLSLRHSGHVVGLELGDTQGRDVVDVAAAVAFMLERNPHGYEWLLLLTVAFNDVCRLEEVRCRSCATGLPHLQHEYDGCTCRRTADEEHTINCDLHGRRRKHDDALLCGE